MTDRLGWTLIHFIWQGKGLKMEYAPCDPQESPECARQMTEVARPSPSRSTGMDHDGRFSGGSCYHHQRPPEHCRPDRPHWCVGQPARNDKGNRMFSSVHAYLHFENAVRTRSRYVFDDEIKAFLAEVVDTVKTRARGVKAGMPFFRAQLGNDWRAEEEAGEPWIPDGRSQTLRRFRISRLPTCSGSVDDQCCCLIWRSMASNSGRWVSKTAAS